MNINSCSLQHHRKALCTLKSCFYRNYFYQETLPSNVNVPCLTAHLVFRHLCWVIFAFCDGQKLNRSTYVVKVADKKQVKLVKITRSRSVCVSFWMHFTIERSPEPAAVSRAANTQTPRNHHVRSHVRLSEVTISSGIFLFYYSHQTNLCLGCKLVLCL